MHALINELCADRESPCVSLYLPLLPGADRMRDNLQRLERLLQELQIRLQQVGLSEKGCVQFLSPARAYGEEHLRTPQSNPGLAIFLSPSSFHATFLSFNPAERAVVCGRFLLQPLLPFSMSSLHYFILAVSRNKVRLLEITGDAVHDHPVDGMPVSLADAWKGMEHQGESQQSHSMGGGHVGFHGGANAKDEAEGETDVFLHKIAKSLHPVVHDKGVPLVFVGVEELAGIYRKHDTSGCLLEGFVHGNPDHLSSADMLAKTNPIVAQHIEKQNNAVLEIYGPLAGTGRTSTELAPILDAAVRGKVDQLLLATGAEQWGIFHTDSGRVTLHEQYELGDEELFGMAAAHTLAHRGRVVTLDPALMPEGSRIAAILRL